MLLFPSAVVLQMPESHKVKAIKILHKQTENLQGQIELYNCAKPKASANMEF